MLPPPKGMAGMKKKTGLPKAKKKSDVEGKGDSVEEKKKKTPEETRMDLEMTRIVAAKKKQVHVILACAVVVICLIIIIGGKWLIQGFSSKTKSAKKTGTTRVNMNTIREKGSSSVSVRRPQAVKASSPLFKEYKNVKNAAKNMPQTNKTEIEAKIKLWEEFVDKNKASHADDKYMKRSEELIKTLKDLKSMY